MQTASGRVLTGRIVGDSPERIVVVTDPEDAAQSVEIPRADVEEILPMTESLMPKIEADPRSIPDPPPYPDKSK